MPDALRETLLGEILQRPMLRPYVIVKPALALAFVDERGKRFALALTPVDLAALQLGIAQAQVELCAGAASGPAAICQRGSEASPL